VFFVKELLKIYNRMSEPKPNAYQKPPQQSQIPSKSFFSLPIWIPSSKGITRHGTPHLLWAVKSPTIADAVEILKMLAGMESKIDKRIEII